MKSFYLLHFSFSAWFLCQFEIISWCVPALVWDQVSIFSGECSGSLRQNPVGLTCKGFCQRDPGTCQQWSWDQSHNETRTREWLCPRPSRSPDGDDQWTHSTWQFLTWIASSSSWAKYICGSVRISTKKIVLKQWGGISESKPREQKASALSSENSILIVSVSWELLVDWYSLRVSLIWFGDLQNRSSSRSVRELRFALTVLTGLSFSSSSSSLSSFSSFSSLSLFSSISLETEASPNVSGQDYFAWKEYKTFDSILHQLLGSQFSRLYVHSCEWVVSL